jgi:D-tyrosyl-tRNA(Tyr) deacylase
MPPDCPRDGAPARRLAHLPVASVPRSRPEVCEDRGVRALIQRVTRAEVRVDGDVVGACRPASGSQGLLVLLGVTHTDTPARAAELAGKVFRLRILDGERAACDLDAPILVVSQFTLYADTGKGRRPSWSAAAPRPVSEPLVDAFVQALRDLGAHVETGAFGAMMQVELVNDGPVTLLLEA